jgi:hypothetical protein
MKQQSIKTELIVGIWFKLVERLFIVGSLLYISRLLKDDPMFYIFFVIFFISFIMLAIQSFDNVIGLIQSFGIKVRGKINMIAAIFSVVEILLLGMAIYIALNLSGIPKL